MKRVFRGVVLVIALIAGACTGGGSRSSGTSASDGPILVQQVSASGGFENTLRITGLSGQDGSIHIPPPSVGLATGVPGKALYPTDSHDVYLVDALRRTAQRLPVPERPTVVPNRAAFGQSDRFVVLGSPKGSPAYLVDAQTGAVTNLTGLGLSKTAFSGEFSPDGSHFVFTGDRLVLVPTAEPKAATTLGPEKAGFAGFTADGTRLGYVDLTDPQHPAAVIEGIDGGGRRVIDLPAHVSRARLVGDGDRLLLEREGRLTVLDVQSGTKRTVLSSRTPPELVWFAPSGRAALIGKGNTSQSGSTSWTWLDLEKGTDRSLPSLAGDGPILSSDRDPLLFFSDGRLPGNARSFSVLNLETGEAHHVFSFPQSRLIAGQAIAPGGRFALLPVQGKGGGGELWLLPAEGGKPRRLATSTGGIAGVFSPSGGWVAVTEVSPGSGGAPPTAGLVAVSTEGNKIRDLGEGVGPVWTRG